MDDLKDLMQANYLEYASYVIKDRAIPSVEDGLKPVQRRILYTLFKLDDGKLHKVANAIGQTMTLHPHGDAAIGDALVNIANKGYLLDRQGNFGNIFTGDSAAASRYIETRLSKMAKETLFNNETTQFVLSYDSRNKEPLLLPAKIPLLLLQGAEGIAVGMSTKILPHNFNDLLKAQIAILENRKFKLTPDFPTGGTVDASEYAKGNGKVRVRCKLEIKDDKTIHIKETCYGNTTESLIKSIEDAAKKGRIKILSIADYTTEKVLIEIKLPRGQYAKDTIESLYAFTECDTSISSNVIVIKDTLPWETNINDILSYNTELLTGYLKQELGIAKAKLNEKIFKKDLEQIFIENKMYNKIENMSTYEDVHNAIEKELQPYHKRLSRIPTYEDREYLLHIPIRRISKFDANKNQADIKLAQKELTEIEKKLKDVTKYTIEYLKSLIEKYGKSFPRKTKIKTFEQVDIRKVSTTKVTIGFDAQSGFIGTKVKSDVTFECTNFDKILVIYKDGTYKVVNPPEKLYLEQDKKKVIYVGIADKKTIMSVIYKDKKTSYPHAKRFVVSKFIIEKEYDFLPSNSKLELITTKKEPVVKVVFKPKSKQKVKELDLIFTEVDIKTVKAKGIRIANKEMQKVSLLKKK
jgi:topoisomerase IV subunit A